MERSRNHYVLLLVMVQFICFGSSRTMKEPPKHLNVITTRQKMMIPSQIQSSKSFTIPISTTKRDITTPITTIPNLFPSTTPTIPTSPILNPNSNPDTFSPPPSPSSPSSPSTFPVTTTTNTPASSSSSSSSSSNSTTEVSNSGASWCIASPSASLRALQVALDYACGYGGADCSGIQAGGSCYNPNSVRDHASFAFNKYYQKNPVPNSCNFGGTALITSTNPSVGACQFPFTSTSSSILNTTNTIGANVFGAVPVPTDPSASAAHVVAKSNINSEILLIIIWAISILEKEIIILSLIIT